MITIFADHKRDYNDYGWSQAYRLFPSNSIHSNAIHELGTTNFGNIVIVNDYILAPGSGFEMHPHQNLEQIFFVIQGECTHHDSLDNTVVLRKNDVQRITAGSGYARSLYNYGETPSRHIGVWLLPETQNTLPTHISRAMILPYGTTLCIRSPRIRRYHKKTPPILPYRSTPQPRCTGRRWIIPN